MIARRSRHKAALPCLVVHQKNGIGGAAELEASGRLMALKLEMDREAATSGKTSG